MQTKLALKKVVFTEVFTLHKCVERDIPTVIIVGLMT
jgi:hypothetical protein